MKLAAILLICFVASAYSTGPHHRKYQYRHNLPSRDSSSESRNQVILNAIKDELVEDVQGGSSCVQALGKTVEENPEILLAKRSIPEHRLAKRGFLGSLWSKINPIKNFYDCGSFLKKKAVKTYQAAKQLAEHYRSRRGLTKYIVSGEKIALAYASSLKNMIDSVAMAAEHLNVTTNEVLGSGKFLHKAATNVKDYLKGYEAKFHLDTAAKVFTKAQSLVTKMEKKMVEINWNHLASFNPKMKSRKVAKFAEELKQSKLAENLMNILNFAQEVSPEFAMLLSSQTNEVIGTVSQTLGEESLNDLTNSIICVDFLTQTTRISEALAKSKTTQMEPLELMGYLKNAVNCEDHVIQHTLLVGDDLVKAGDKLREKLLRSVNVTRAYLTQLEQHLSFVERPVKTLMDSEEKMMMSAVTLVKSFLDDIVNSIRPDSISKTFMDVVKALQVVEKSLDGVTLEVGSSLSKRGVEDVIRSFLPFEAGSYENGKMEMIDTATVSYMAGVAQSFIDIVQFARKNSPLLVTL